ncbi:glutamate 5-kinase [Paraburkholderia solisilvae]|uniref:Glutamate 5-kinase n=1 Tax=Paraburkholderia solisilvae TaxID=624376 RepID=A0A6J5EFX9_9BURK|nr:glutamate 5-kinase [Paraburkholderia solisilvae]CAB3764261.1 Glutamate 5-kinase [Paraburkholderia solisilvae]
MPNETRWVVKIGSALLTSDGKGLDHRALARWADEMAELHHAGLEIVIVSSGAVAEGMSRLGWCRTPRDISALQAAAAIGQMGLMHAYETSFRARRICAAQVLLTHEDFASRQRYLNVQATLRKLVQMRAMAVINENDTVSTEEIRFGDNDMLAALVANMVAADRLVILTDQAGLLCGDPRTEPRAGLISEACVDDDALLGIAGGVAAAGSSAGGMLSKVKSARLFALSGGITTLACGHIDGVLGKIRSGVAVGTELRPGRQRLVETDRWLAGQLVTHGTIVLDAEAADAVVRRHRGVRPNGVLRVRGTFERDEVIEITDPHERVLAKGISNYSAREMSRIVDRWSASAHAAPPDQHVTELVNRGNIVLDFYNRRT